MTSSTDDTSEPHAVAAAGGDKPPRMDGLSAADLPFAHVQPTIDDEFRRLIPPLDPNEHRELEANLLADGRARDPLVTWNGVLLDGHNRYDICQRHNLPFTVTSVELPDRDAAKMWIIRNQLGRRNLPPFARVELALALEPLIAADAKKRMLAGHPVPKSAQGRTRTTVAEIAGVGGSAVAEAKLILAEGSDAEKDALRSGEVAIHSVYSDIKGRKHPDGRRQRRGADARNQETVGSEERRLPTPNEVTETTEASGSEVGHEMEMLLMAIPVPVRLPQHRCDALVPMMRVVLMTQNVAPRDFGTPVVLGYGTPRPRQCGRSAWAEQMRTEVDRLSQEYADDAEWVAAVSTLFPHMSDPSFAAVIAQMKNGVGRLAELVLHVPTDSPEANKLLARVEGLFAAITPAAVRRLVQMDARKRRKSLLRYSVETATVSVETLADEVLYWQERAHKQIGGDNQ